MLENAKKRSRRPHGDARNAKRSLAGPTRQRPLPAEDRMRCGGMKEKESSLSLCSLRARASAPPPTASAMRRGGLGAVVGDRAVTREAPSDAAFLCFFSFAVRRSRRCLAPPILPPSRSRAPVSIHSPLPLSPPNADQNTIPPFTQTSARRTGRSWTGRRRPRSPRPVSSFFLSEFKSSVLGIRSRRRSPLLSRFDVDPVTHLVPFFRKKQKKTENAQKTSAASSAASAS